MRSYALATLVSSLVLLGMVPAAVAAQKPTPLNLIIIWHFHQPWYYDASGEKFFLPWVRMHSVGNYYKMAYILSKHPNIRVSFTFSGSLLVQLRDYVENGLMDVREEISWKIANGSRLSIEEKFSMIQIPGGFFDINWKRVVDVVPRYSELRDRAQKVLAEYQHLPQQEYMAKVAESFTEQDYVDLAALFNLFWIDPMVLKEKFPELYRLREEAIKNPNIHFTREDLKNILSAQRSIMSEIASIYRELAAKGQIELVPVPYSHPLSAIIADFGWADDLKVHAVKSIELFKELFGYKPSGVWPPEQAVNDYVVEAYSEFFNWTVTDQTVLAKTGIDVSKPENTLYPWIFRTESGKRVYVFFRNTELSNLISFTYSNMPSEEAVEDLVSRLLAIRESSGPGAVVVIALDGENPWEWYEEFGDKFLDLFYARLEELQAQGLIRTITPSEYISEYSDYAKELPASLHEYLDLEGRDIADIPVSYTADAYSELPRRKVESQLAEGSWASGELAMWIGQRQENAAWMLLAKTREDLLEKLGVKSLAEAYKVNPEAVENLLRAEASDWFWWYGGDAGGGFPANPLFKTYLANVYRSLGLKPPHYLLAFFNPDATPVGTINREVPKPVTQPPRIDGEYNDEAWATALPMEVGADYIDKVLVAVDAYNMYIALIPAKKDILADPNLEVSIYLTSPWRSVSPYNLGYNSFPKTSMQDLGMGLFYEVRIKPSESLAEIYIADGRGGWLKLFQVQDIKVGEIAELVVPWNMVSLRQSDIVYLTAASYYNGSLVETATRIGLTYYLQVPRPAAVQGKVIIDVEDPVGDDDGAGGYEYPKNTVFKPGVFDLTRFRVVDTGPKLVFEVYVRDLGGNPWNGPNGFCLQYVHIYVHTTADTKGNTTTFGLNTVIDPKHAWHFALLLAPGWGSEPVPVGERSALYYANGTVVVQDGPFKVYGDPQRNAIIAEVSKNLLPDVENADKWVFVVALTSYDGYGPQRIRPFGVNAEEWVVGTGREYAQAIVFNVVPRIMDLLAPDTETQYSILNSFKIDAAAGKAEPAVLHGFSKQDFQAPTATTATVTITLTKTIEKPVERTVTETVSTTVTRTLKTTTTLTTEKTVHRTITETVEKAVKETNTAITIVLAVLAFMVGIGIGYIASRK